MNIANEIKIGGIIAAVFIAIIIFVFVNNKSILFTGIDKTKLTESKSAAINDNVSNFFTFSEIKIHNNKDDCWIVINNNVYNVTSYLSLHPGGSTTIIPFCGNNASDAFFSERKHGARALSDLDSLLIGKQK